MRSVADDLRAESRARIRELSPSARMSLALRLGDEDLALVAAARGLEPAQARAAIAAARSIGRVFSASNAGDRA